MLYRLTNHLLLWRSVAPQCSWMAKKISTTPTWMQTAQKYTSRPKPAEKIPDGRGCPLCRAGLHKFGYRDVLLLRQFLSPEGYLIGRRQTGVCPKMQRRITKAIRRSRQLGLLPNFSTHTPTTAREK